MTLERSESEKAGGRARNSTPDEILERDEKQARGDEISDGNTTPTTHAEMEEREHIPPQARQAFIGTP